MIRRHFLAGVVGLKAMCAAAALMVGVGQAEAAVMPSPYGTYDVEFTLEGVYSACNITCEDPVQVPYAGMSLGDTQRGVLDIREGSNPYTIVVDFSWVGGVLADDLELIGTVGNSYANSLYFALSWERIGGLFTGMFTGVNYPLNNGDIEQLNDFRFTEIAPVPLPMAGTLLPVGIGALAMMRKRRKSGQAGTV